MQLTLHELETALAPIAEVGQGELTFPVNGLQVTIRIMTPEEELDVQRFANEALQGGGETLSNNTDYFTRFKLALLSHVIVAVGDQDLRTVEFIETDDVLPNNQRVKLPKAQALRKVLRKWTGLTLLNVFSKYGELLKRVEREAEQAIKFDVVDLSEEITRVEKRLSELKAEQEKATQQEKLEQTKVSRMAKALANTRPEDQPGFMAGMTHVISSETKREELEENVELPEGADDYVEESPQYIEPVVKTRQPVTPVSAPPPGAVKRPTPPQQPVSQEKRAPLPLAQEDSFVDPSDSDAMTAAMALENQRMLQIRQQNASGPMQHTSLRKPPHLEARDAQAALAHAQGYSSEELDDSQLVPHRTGKPLDGIEAALRMPVEEIVRPDTKMAQGQPPKSSANPRFRPVNRG